MGKREPLHKDALCINCAHWDRAGDTTDGLRQCTNKDTLAAMAGGIKKWDYRQKENKLRTTWDFFCRGFMWRRGTSRIEMPTDGKIISLNKEKK